MTTQKQHNTDNMQFISFYNKMPDFYIPLDIIHNTTSIKSEAIRTPNGLISNGIRISGCFYSWKYKNN